MTMQPCAARSLYLSHQDVVCRSEVLSLEMLSGKMQSMYAIPTQCRIELIGQDGTSPDDPTLRRWVYSVTMPLMLISETRAQRGEVHLGAELLTPFSEEKMRFGCQLQCDCDVYPRCASELSPGVYRVTYDAHVSLYSTLLRAC